MVGTPPERTRPVGYGLFVGSLPTFVAHRAYLWRSQCFGCDDSPPLVDFFTQPRSVGDRRPYNWNLNGYFPDSWQLLDRTVESSLVSGEGDYSLKSLGGSVSYLYREGPRQSYRCLIYRSYKGRSGKTGCWRLKKTRVSQGYESGQRGTVYLPYWTFQSKHLDGPPGRRMRERRLSWELPILRTKRPTQNQSTKPPPKNVGPKNRRCPVRRKVR